MNTEVNTELGNQIRKYRKANKMTLDELAAKINKSKATLSKYENGSISIDILTLSEIAECLHVSTAHLVASTFSGCRGIGEDGADSGAGNVRRYYMYFLDGRIKKLVISLLLVTDHLTGGRREAYLHYHMDDFTRPERCKGFYAGDLSAANPYMNFAFQNKNNDIESLFIVAKKTFNDSSILCGLLTAISFSTFQPISYKVILSEHELAQNDVLFRRLRIGKEDISLIRHYNVLALSENYDTFNYA
jgi:transcriptional regulator with XRE-family HTH domain